MRIRDSGVCFVRGMVMGRQELDSKIDASDADLRGKFPISESHIQLYTVFIVLIKSRSCSKNSVRIFIINLRCIGVR